MSWVLILPNGTQAAHSKPRNTFNDRNILLLVVLHKPSCSGTCWVLPEIPQHHLQEAKGSTAPLEQPWKLGWKCRNQQALGNAGWSKSQTESWAPSAIQSALSTPLAALLQPKAMPEVSVNLEQHIVTACIWRFTLEAAEQIFPSSLWGHSHSSTLSRWPKSLLKCGVQTGYSLQQEFYNCKQDWCLILQTRLILCILVYLPFFFL